MAELITKQTAHSVDKFLAGIKDPARKRDCIALRTMFEQWTGKKAVMWGTAIVGFGNYHYVYDSGREGDFFCVGFSPRKKNVTLYIVAGIGYYPDMMKKLGACRSAGSCIYIKALGDINLTVLKKLVRTSVMDLRKKNNSNKK